MKLELCGTIPDGNPDWLGAKPVKERRVINFSFYAGAAAEKLEVCVFDKAENPTRKLRFEMTAKEPVRNDDGGVIGELNLPVRKNGRSSGCICGAEVAKG